MKTKIHTLLALCAIAALALFSGCASTGSADAPVLDDETREIALEFITKAATSEILGGDTALAAEVQAGAQLIREAITTGQLVLPTAVQDAATDLIADLDIETSTKVQLDNFVDLMQRHYLARIDTGEILAGNTEALVNILTWVEAACADTLRYGTVQTYGTAPLPADVAEHYDLSAQEAVYIVRLVSLVLDWFTSK